MIAKTRSQHYYASYGPIQIETTTLAACRRQAKQLAKRVKYNIPIVHRGDVIDIALFRRGSSR